MPKVECDFDFWFDKDDRKSAVLQIFPDVHRDSRGCFLESWKLVEGVDKDVEDKTSWIFKENWIRQINTSYSCGRVIRGLHAQRGEYCQAKLVSSLSGFIYDVIVDARPESTTFKKAKLYCLSPKLQNKLFVPRGFLHAFCTGNGDSGKEYVFQYMCDNVYDKASELTVRPTETVMKAFSEYCDRTGLDNFLEYDENRGMPVIADKDSSGTIPQNFFNNVLDVYNTTGKLWYKPPKDAAGKYSM